MKLTIRWTKMVRKNKNYHFLLNDQTLNVLTKHVLTNVHVYIPIKQIKISIVPCISIPYSYVHATHSI